MGSRTQKPPVTADKPVKRKPARARSEADRLADALIENLHHLQGKLPRHATTYDWYMALAYTIRNRTIDRYIESVDAITSTETSAKVVAYLSAEFLTGPHLGNSLIALGLFEDAREAASRVGQDLDVLIQHEQEPGLGNGGLGRLAACYMDSLATLNVPAIGYGIRYEFGIFDQAIRDGWQVELTDKWLRFGNPWEIVRSEVTFDVKLGGRTEHSADAQGRLRVTWIPDRVVRGMAHDTPVPGYHAGTTNLLRLWKAEATDEFDFAEFNVGDYWGAVDQKIVSETISKVLYPNDEPAVGKKLRLSQQYFFVSCSLQDMLRLHRIRGKPLEELSDCWAAQLNDTHPSIAVAELMRLLVDEHGMDWDRAWAITQRTCGYTNHTLLSEALEKWPLSLFGQLLPRHLEIVYEINRRFLDEVRSRHPGDDGLLARLSLIDEAGGKSVRMANLASVGSHAINGVAALHTALLEQTVLRDFHAVSPEKFVNVTNGVTPRRWIALSNPTLSALLTRRIGDRWIANLEEELPRLEPLAADPGFRKEWQGVKAGNKIALAALLRERTGVTVDPRSLFDVQVKRLHEYKRQHLNVLWVIAHYNRLRRSPGGAVTPRTVIFGGKAAPGYRMAKLIIKLIHSVAGVVNQDSLVSDALKVVFLPDFNVTNGQRVYPAADLSEQISTAGKEASGTGNMKFAMNGALTIGTLDGANVEIREAVGPENFFLFGTDGRRGRAAPGRRLRSARRPRIQRRAARGHRPPRVGLLLRRRPGALPSARGIPASAGRVHAPGRLSLVRRLPGTGERSVPRPGELDAHVHPQLRARRPLLVGPLDPGLLPRHLGIDPSTWRDPRMKRPGKTGKGKSMDARVLDRQAAPETSTLSERELELINAYWRACNYLAVGMIYLQDNPLLREPLKPEHVKHRLLGHWGASPALSFVWVHLNRLIVRDDLDMIFVAGPGHGAPGRPRAGLSRGDVLRDLPRQERGRRGAAEVLQAVLVPRPHRQPRHAGDARAPFTRAASSATASRTRTAMAFDNPDLIVACVVGDGEAETGPLATAWHSNKFLNPARDGAVLPILNLNGYKIANPTILARIRHEELEALFVGYGYKPYFVEGIGARRDAPEDGRDARAGHRRHPRRPGIGAGIPGPRPPALAHDRPAIAEGLDRTEGDQGPQGRRLLAVAPGAGRRRPGQSGEPQLLEEWMQSYAPRELFDDDGRLMPELQALAPKGQRRMSANPHANGGLLRKPLKLPDFRKYAVAVPSRGAVSYENTRPLGEFLRDVMKNNMTSFRVFGPDETASNRLQAIYEASKKTWMAEMLPEDARRERAVTRRPRHGNALRAHADRMAGGVPSHRTSRVLPHLRGVRPRHRLDVQPARQVARHLARTTFPGEPRWPRRTSFSPRRSGARITTGSPTRTRGSSTSSRTRARRSRASTCRPTPTRSSPSPITASGAPTTSTSSSPTSRNTCSSLSIDEAVLHCAKGLGIWARAQHRRRARSRTSSWPACGDVATMEALAAAAILRERVPDLKLRFVNVVDLFRLQPATEHPHGSTEREFDGLFTTDKPIIFNFHGYPWLIHKLAYRFQGHENLHVRGYKEKGNINTPLELAMLNETSRFHLVIDVIDRVPDAAHEGGASEGGDEERHPRAT